jgi:hypothetical protein
VRLEACTWAMPGPCLSAAWIECDSLPSMSVTFWCSDITMSLQVVVLSAQELGIYIGMVVFEIAGDEFQMSSRIFRAGFQDVINGDGVFPCHIDFNNIGCDFLIFEFSLGVARINMISVFFRVPSGLITAAARSVNYGLS